MRALRLSISSFDCMRNIDIIISAVVLDFAESGSVEVSLLRTMVESPAAATESRRIAIPDRALEDRSSSTRSVSGTTSFTSQIIGSGLMPSVARNVMRIESPG